MSTSSPAADPHPSRLLIVQTPEKALSGWNRGEEENVDVVNLDAPFASAVIGTKNKAGRAAFRGAGGAVSGLAGAIFRL